VQRTFSQSHVAKEPDTPAFPSHMSCKAAVLKMPTCHDFPPELQSLSTNDQRVLSFFKILTGPYRRVQHGYRVKTHALDHLKLDFIDDEIDAIAEPLRRLRLRKAFEFLMNCPDSHYSHFFNQRHMLELKESYNLAELSKIKFIETALWPVLYYRDDFCESAISQAADTKLSRKKHFFHKCLGPVINYSLDFALLQFQYKRWCYQIITGTIRVWEKVWCLIGYSHGLETHQSHLLALATLHSPRHSRAFRIS